MTRTHQPVVDLDAPANVFADPSLPLPEPALTNHVPIIQQARHNMFQAALLRHQGDPSWRKVEAKAFDQLRETIVLENQLKPTIPRRRIQQREIVWGRSPARLDLAGGWSDTPPYCLEHGGSVLNAAADLNGCPPIQVFAKLCVRPELVLRSLDQGLTERVCSYEQLRDFNRPEHAFSIAKGALALAGFLPELSSHHGFSSLEQQLKEFGGGLEISLLSSLPKGSGLGTSSILAATALGTLSDACGLGWTRDDLFHRTLVLEQMLTTGGGWQDQAGALYQGLKVVETCAGLIQHPRVRWLPNSFFGENRANKAILLYYTGLTRLAKNILSEVVRGVFLNSPGCLHTIDAIKANVERASTAIQSCDYCNLLESVRTSWSLNQRLDRGTNPPAVQQILNRIEDYLGAAKLLGAGGGGYLLLFAKDDTAASRIKNVLFAAPPNPNARFVDFKISQRGFQVSRTEQSS